MLDGPPPGSEVVHALLAVGRQADQGRHVLWADVAEDGTLATGDGGPRWWPDDPQPC